MGVGMAYFKSACEAKAIPWAQIIQMLLSLFSNCPTPPASKADMERVRFKRIRLVVAGVEQQGLSWEAAGTQADSVLSILAESTDEQASAFLSEIN